MIWRIYRCHQGNLRTNNHYYVRAWHCSWRSPGDQVRYSTLTSQADRYFVRNPATVRRYNQYRVVVPSYANTLTYGFLGKARGHCTIEIIGTMVLPMVPEGFGAGRRWEQMLPAPRRLRTRPEPRCRPGQAGRGRWPSAAPGPRASSPRRGPRARPGCSTRGPDTSRPRS